MIITLGAKDRLFLRAHTQCRQGARRTLCPLDDFVGFVDRKLRAGAVVEFDLVRRPVDGAHIPGDVTQRPGIDIQVIWQGGFKERDSDVNSGILEFINASGRCDLDRLLREGWEIIRRRTHQAVALSVDTNYTDEGLVPTGPMLGRGIIEMIRRRPDT